MEKLSATTAEIEPPRLTETLKSRLETKLHQLNEVDDRISNSLIKLTGFTPENAKGDASGMMEAGVLGEIYNLLGALGDIVNRLNHSADILETTV
jgi:hypothetical protein